MKRKEVEQSLRDAIARETPDVLDKVLSQLENDRRQATMETEAKKQNNRTNKRGWARYVAAAAAVLALVAVGGMGLNGLQARKVDSVIAIDVNPSVELSVNKNDVVLFAKALNADAEQILGGMDLKNAHLDVAVNALIGSMLRQGYIDTLKNSVLVSVESGDEERGQRLQAAVTADIDAALSQASVAGAVLGLQVGGSEELKKFAETYGISQGKATIIQDILALDSTHTPQELATLSVQDLTLISLSKNPVAAEEMVTSGTVSEGGYLGRKRAGELALAKLPGATLGDLEFDYEGGRPVYEGELYKDGVEYEFEMDAVSGEFLQWEGDRYDQRDNNWDDDRPAAAPAGSEDMGLDEAKALALARVPGAQVGKLKRDYDDGRLRYEGKLYLDGVEYEFEIDAATGDFLQWEEDREDTRPTPAAASPAATATPKAQSRDIGLEKAKALALGRVSGATLREIEKDYDDGRLTYEGELYKDGVEYEFEIDAATGKFLKWAEDRDD